MGTQVPAWQSWSDVHARPQAPQFVMLAVVFVSQPFDATPSQLPKPVAQPTTVHPPAAQPYTDTFVSVHKCPHDPQFDGSVAVFVQIDGAAPQVTFGDAQMEPHTPAEHTCPAPHACPQAPQFAPSALVFTSQPSAAEPLQFAKPALHAAMAQVLDAQRADAFASTHGVPHDPQCVVALVRSVSQPFDAVPSQSPKPDAQVTTVHARPEQPFTEACASAQTVPQPPQLRGSMARSVQYAVAPVPQTTVGAAQVVPHTPAAQVCPARQVVPQAPQFALSLRVSTSQPSDATPLQFAKPAAHAPAAMVHAPATHACDVTCGRAHAAPHAPQLAALVPRFVSQPLLATPSQSPSPVAQRDTAQDPPAHAATEVPGSEHVRPQVPQFDGSLPVFAQYPGVAPTAGHVVRLLAQVVPHTPAEHTWPAPQLTPQAPQLALSVRVFTSQPSAATPSQSAKPAAHAVSPHDPPPHAALALGSAHARPHAPQLPLLVCRFVSQPLLATPSQSPVPLLQRTTVHAPAAQPLAAVEGSAHDVAHAPQLSGSMAVLAQNGGADPTAGHVARPRAQVVPHAPPEHTWPAAHVVPQVPQFALSVRASTSQPFDGSPSQSAKPVRHAAIPQRPPLHAAVAFGSTHARPHAPQLAALVSRSVSQPFGAMPSQSPVFASQCTMVHAPPTHPSVDTCGSAQTVPQAPQFVGSMEVRVQNAVTPVPHVARPAPQVVPHAPAEHTWPAEHAMPQLPQLVLSVRVSVSQPSLGTPLQSAKPAAHPPVGITHAPATHDCADTCGRAHAAPHAPQFAVEVCVSVSQPFGATPSQSPKEGLQRTTVHIPAVHPSTVVFGSAQTAPQPPQLLGSMRVSAQRVTPPSPPHVTRGGAQVVPHAPPEHTCPAPHVVPHAPQLALSVCRFAQLAPHTVSPAPQFGRHVPAEHAWPAGQCVPHAPQLWSSVRRFTHSVPHAVCPAGHDTLHIPAMQTLPAGQTVPQVPQLERSDARSAQ